MAFRRRAGRVLPSILIGGLSTLDRGGSGTLTGQCSHSIGGVIGSVVNGIPFNMTWSGHGLWLFFHLTYLYASVADVISPNC
jgi:hypothetical protein